MSISAVNAATSANSVMNQSSKVASPQNTSSIQIGISDQVTLSDGAKDQLRRHEKIQADAAEMFNHALETNFSLSSFPGYLKQDTTLLSENQTLFDSLEKQGAFIRSQINANIANGGDPVIDNNLQNQRADVSGKLAILRTYGDKEVLSGHDVGDKLASWNIAFQKMAEHLSQNESEEVKEMKSEFQRQMQQTAAAWKEHDRTHNIEHALEDKSLVSSSFSFSNNKIAQETMLKILQLNTSKNNY